MRPGSNFPIELVSFTSHDHRPIQRNFAKMLQVRLQTPRQLAVSANDEVVSNRCDQNKFHPGASRYTNARKAAATRVAVSIETSE